MGDIINTTNVLLIISVNDELVKQRMAKVDEESEPRRERKDSDAIS